MLPKRSGIFTLIYLFCATAALHATSLPLVWPTPSTKFLERKHPSEFLMPTEVGDWTSGMYGDVRNNGARFHEGIDIATEELDSRGEARDAIFAILPGTVVHTSSTASDSSYGQYVVIKHHAIDVPVYSLYAHLSRIDNAIKPGVKVNAGTRIGIMGRSAGGYRIPKNRSHLHLEIGLRLSDNFGDWYARQDYSEPNKHGVWNGMNLMGFDPLEFYQTVIDGRYTDMQSYLQQQRIAFRAIVKTPVIPDFITRYPALVEGGEIPKRVKGWLIGCNVYGLPITWRPLEALDQSVPLKFINVEKEDFQTRASRRILKFQGDTVIPGHHFKRYLELLFGQEVVK